MQKTDFYKQLLTLPDLHVQRVEYCRNRISLFCWLKTTKQPRPHCLNLTKEVNQHTTRQVRDLDISGRQVWLHLQIKQSLRRPGHLSEL